MIEAWMVILILTYPTGEMRSQEITGFRTEKGCREVAKKWEEIPGYGTSKAVCIRYRQGKR